MQTHSRSGQCRSFDFPLVTVARRFAVKSDWLVVCKLSVYFNACCVCLYMLHNTDYCICRLPNIYYYCSTSFITCVIWEINSPGSFSDAEIKVLMLVLSRFAFLYQLYKITVLGCRQVALVYVSTCTALARASLHPPRPPAG